MLSTYVLRDSALHWRPFHVQTVILNLGYVALARIPIPVEQRTS